MSVDNKKKYPKSHKTSHSQCRDEMLVVLFRNFFQLFLFSLYDKDHKVWFLIIWLKRHLLVMYHLHQGPLEYQVTAGLVSFPPRCRVVRLVFGSAFFQTSLFAPSIRWQGFEKNVVGSGSVRL